MKVYARYLQEKLIVGGKEKDEVESGGTERLWTKRSRDRASESGVPHSLSIVAGTEEPQARHDRCTSGPHRRTGRTTRIT